MKTKQCNGLSSPFRVTNHFVSFHTQPHCPTLRQGFFFSVSSKFAGNWSPSHLLKPVSRSLIQALLWLIALLQWQHFVFSHWSYIHIYVHTHIYIYLCRKRDTFLSCSYTLSSQILSSCLCWRATSGKHRQSERSGMKRSPNPPCWQCLSKSRQQSPLSQLTVLNIRRKHEFFFPKKL